MSDAFQELETPRLPFVLRQFRAGPHENFHYAVGDPETRQVALIDPVFRLDALFAALERDGLRPDCILLTHGHWDHIGGLSECLDRGIHTVVAHEEAARLEPLRNARDRGADVRSLPDGADLHVGGVPVTLLHTPGHQPEAACYLAGDPAGPRALFGGDTLFVGSCGRTDFPGGDTDAMFASMARLRALADEDIRVFPGHDYAEAPHRALQDEVQDNPALATTDRDAFGALHCLTH